MTVKVRVLLFLIIPCCSAVPMRECIPGDVSCTADDVADASHLSLLQSKFEVGSPEKAPQVHSAGHMKNITEAFAASGTDKLWRHGYHRYYETELAPYRDIEGVRLLEIGAQYGKSLGAWMEYFTSPAAVEGIAYEVDAQEAKKKACDLMPAACDKLKIYSMDQSNVTALRSLKKQNPEGWDIIVDDGSHLPQHQLISFQQLWPKLRSGGLYAIEDIETSYVDNGKQIYDYHLRDGGIDVLKLGEHGPKNTVEQFKRLVDVVSRRHFGHPELTVFAGVDEDVARVTFADGIIFVQKKPASPDWDKYPNITSLGVKADDTARTYSAYEKKIEPVNSFFEKLG